MKRASSDSLFDELPTPGGAALACTLAVSSKGAPVRGWTPKRIATRSALLLVTGISLYFLLPSLAAVFGSWGDLFELQPQWVAIAFGFEALSFVSTWALQRIALRSPSWFAVGTSQL